VTAIRRHASAVVPPCASTISTSRSLPIISSGLCFLLGIRRPFRDPDYHSRWTTQTGADHGQVSDYTGAAALLDDLPKAQWLLGDRGYDADWFTDALQAKGIQPCIPGRKSRTDPIKYDKRRYRRRSRIEIMFGRLKDWRRVATRYDRCPTVFFSAIALAATVIFWL
jgi:transposase